MPANAVINQVSSLAGILGPVLGGLLYGSFGLLPVLWVSAICFLASAVLECFIRIPHMPRPTQTVKKPLFSRIENRGFSLQDATNVQSE